MAEDLLPATLPPPDLVIDALLGTGVHPSPRQ
jgi:NAD(P)H-hydrate epimerase